MQYGLRLLNTKTFAVLDLNFAILSLGVELHCRFPKKKKKNSITNKNVTYSVYYEVLLHENFLDS